jgi:hypothetical protein
MRSRLGPGVTATIVAAVGSSTTRSAARVYTYAATTIL